MQTEAVTMKSLEEVAFVIDRTHYTPKYQNDGIPCVSTANFTESGIDLSSCKKISEEDFKNESERCNPEDGDILFSRIGTIGETRWAPPGKFLPLHSLVLIKPYRDQIEPKYLYYYLKSPTLLRQAHKGVQSISVPDLGIKLIKKFSVPIPPREQQQKIALILEKAEQAKELRKKADELTNELLKAAFSEIISSSNKSTRQSKNAKLGDVADILMGQSPNGESYNNLAKGMPLLNGPTEFGIKHPTEKQWTTSPMKIAPKGSILFCVRGATAGRMNWAEKEYCIGRGLAAINSKTDLSNRFIFEFLRTKYDYFQNIGQGSTFINLSRESIANLLIPYPDKSMMNKFVDIANRVEEIRDSQRDLGKHIDNFFDSSIQRAFNGELVC